MRSENLMHRISSQSESALRDEEDPPILRRRGSNHDLVHGANEVGAPAGRHHHDATTDSEEFYRDQYLRMCEMNHVLTLQIDRLSRENKKLTRSLAQHQLHLSSCRSRLEALTVANGSFNGGHKEPYAREKDTRRISHLEGERPSISPGPDSKFSSPERKFVVPNCFRRVETLRGHTGAVYVVKFSPNGKLAASGALDQTVRVWDVSGLSDSRNVPAKEVTFLRGHAINVSALTWATDQRSLLSGSFDRSVMLWDVQSEKQVARFDLPGMVQSITWATDSGLVQRSGSRKKIKPASSDLGSNVFYCAFSKSTVWGFDRRAGNKRCQEIGSLPSSSGNSRSGDQASTSDGMINSVRIPLDNDASCLASGDSKGRVRLWSLRTGRCIQEWSAGKEKRPVSCLSGLSSLNLLSANSYDDILRIYRLPDNVRAKEIKLLCSLRSHKNSNWPIKSSMFHGNTTQYPAKGFSTDTKSESISPADTKSGSLSPSTLPSIRTLVATGSTDHNAYVFDVTFVAARQSGKAKDSQSGQNRIPDPLSPGVGDGVEVLSGHKGRVYSVDFHPERPILATASEDSSIQLWIYHQPAKSSEGEAESSSQ